ncbi:MAG: RNA polymerase sigma factor [Gammaproteobacteria bacterium]|nr:RNA polymerase sigma factor [Gammaproteobacteria bacterium]
MHQIEALRPQLYRVAVSWCNDEMLADDIVQDALAKAVQNISQLKDPEALKSWLFTILNNQWREYLRRNRPCLDIDELIFIADSDPEADEQRQQTCHQVRLAIAELPLSQRQTITLVDLEDMSYQEVAKALDVPIGTVMSRLNRARKALLQKIEHQEKTMSISYLRSVK